MDIQLRKLKVMEMLLKVKSEALMKEVEQLLENELIVGYTTTGEPLTKEAYKKELTETKKDIAEQKTLSSEDLKAKYGLE